MPHGCLLLAQLGLWAESRLQVISAGTVGMRLPPLSLGPSYILPMDYCFPQIPERMRLDPSAYPEYFQELDSGQPHVRPLNGPPI